MSTLIPLDPAPTVASAASLSVLAAAVTTP